MLSLPKDSMALTKKVGNSGSWVIKYYSAAVEMYYIVEGEVLRYVSENAVEAEAFFNSY